MKGLAMVALPNPSHLHSSPTLFLSNQATNPQHHPAALPSFVNSGNNPRATETVPQTPCDHVEVKMITSSSAVDHPHSPKQKPTDWLAMGNGVSLLKNSWRSKKFLNIIPFSEGALGLFTALCQWNYPIKGIAKCFNCEIYASWVVIIEVEDKHTTNTTLNFPVLQILCPLKKGGFHPMGGLTSPL